MNSTFECEQLLAAFLVSLREIISFPFINLIEAFSGFQGASGTQCWGLGACDWHVAGIWLSLMAGMLPACGQHVTEMLPAYCKLFAIVWLVRCHLTPACCEQVASTIIFLFCELVASTKSPLRSGAKVPLALFEMNCLIAFQSQFIKLLFDKKGIISLKIFQSRSVILLYSQQGH